MNKRQVIALLSCLIVGMAGFVGAYTAEKSQENITQNARTEDSKNPSSAANPKPSDRIAQSDAVAKSDEKSNDKAGTTTETAADAGTDTSTNTSTTVDSTATTVKNADANVAGRTNNNSTVEKETVSTSKNKPKAVSKAQKETVPPNSEEVSSARATESVEEVKAVETVASQNNDGLIHFTPQDGLRWPLEGDVIMNYSMDHRIFFETLQQYQYNPALVIGGDVNDKVYIIAKGTITDISTDEEIGCTVTEDLGDGYTAIYGQLKELNFNVGDHVERGQVIGYVSEPTKYYSLEGSNLYFAMQKDGEPIDPLEYYE